MNVLFHDVHNDPELEKILEDNKVIGAMFHEILYADDTIIYSRNAKTLTKLLNKIQAEGEKYGLNLNEEKCENININSQWGNKIQERRKSQTNRRSKIPWMLTKRR